MIAYAGTTGTCLKVSPNAYVEDMDVHADTREFLTSRRNRLTPNDAGLPIYQGKRRVPGLRREEVAMLAGVSVDYYTRLERGNLSGVSEQVLSALATALQLDDAETQHLFDLAKLSNSPASRRKRTPAPKSVLRPEVLRILNSMHDIPAYIRSESRDLLAANTFGRALYAPLYESTVSDGISGEPGSINVARFTFLDPAAREFFPEWERTSADLVASLRAVAAQRPNDTLFSNFIGELVTKSEVFAQMWADHNVRMHRTGSKKIVHPLVGEMELDFETLDLPVDPDIALVVYSAAEGSTSAMNLQLLANWTGNDSPSLSTELGDTI